MGLTRRQWLTAAAGLGGFIGVPLIRTANAQRADLPHFTPKARRVIYLFQSGGPSQLELFDHKPGLADWEGMELPPSVRGDQRLAQTAGQEALPVVNPRVTFSQHGESGAWVSDLLPYTAAQADKLCFVRSMHTDAINHDPAMTLFQTGHDRPGRPALGAWLGYGLGRANGDLPGFVVLISKTGDAQPLYQRLWSAGFLPSQHQGVKFRADRNPVLYLNDEAAVTAGARSRMYSAIRTLDRQRLASTRDPELATRLEAYDLAMRLQSSIPELADLSNESPRTLDMYGPDAQRPGTFAANCLLARRLAERDVRFIQLYHRGWDQHFAISQNIRPPARATDQPVAALLLDLEQRGLLDDTLVVWTGEFGRTVFAQGNADENFGRDHHGRCFTAWLAGAGIRPGITYGETDDFSYNIVDRPVSVFDFNATILHVLGIDHQRLTYRFQGRQFRLTDVFGEVISEILA